MVSLKNTKIIIGIVIIILFAGGIILYNNKNNRQSAQTPTVDQVKPDINYDPPTEEEKKQADNNKAHLIEAEKKDQSPPSASNKTSITPEITIAEAAGEFIELGSYVPGIFENNGVCTATFTRNAKIITRQVKSVAEGRATYCPLIKIPVNEFTEKGTWQVKVAYDSAAYTGTSPGRSIEVK